MSALTPNYNPNGLHPKIIINDKDGVEQFTYESESVKSLHPLSSYDLDEKPIDLYQRSDGTWTGTETYGIGNINKAASFNGSSYITLDNESNFDFIDRTSAWSVSFWFKYSSSSSQLLICKGTSVNSTAGLYIYNNNSDILVMGLINTGSTNELRQPVSGSSHNDGLWHHCVITKAAGTGSSSELTTYIDGADDTQAATIDTLTGDPTNNESMVFGAESDAGLPYTGDLQLVNFYDFELSSSQVAELFASIASFGTVSSAASAVQDFRLTDGGFHIGTNDDFGFLTFVLDDANNIMTDGTSKANPLILQQWEVELFLGKTSSNLNRWFYGKVLDVTVARPITAMKQLTVTVVGWAVKTRNRYTEIKRFQDKEADGITVDATDDDSKVSEVAKDIFVDTDHYISEGIPGEPEITVSGIEDIDIKLPDFQQTGQTWASAMSTLSAWANAYWGIDANRDVYLRQVGTKNSGILITNDLDGLDAQGWNPAKIGYLQDSVFEWSNNSAEGAFSILHAWGGNEIKLNLEEDNTANSVFNLDTGYLAWKIEPTHDNIEKISLSLNRTGTPATGKAEFIIVGDDGSGGPNIEDIRGVGIIGEEKLQAMPTSGTNWTEISFNIRGGISISPREELFIVVKLYGTASNTFGVENDTTVDTNYWTSTDPEGVGWTQVSGASGVTFQYRVYTNRSVTVTVEDLTARIDFGIREVGFSMRQDVQVETIQEALIQASKTLGKPRRIYKDVVSSPISCVVPVGKYCRIQDEMSGLDILVDIIAVNGSFSADDTSNMGVEELELTLQEF